MGKVSFLHRNHLDPCKIAIPQIHLLNWTLGAKPEICIYQAPLIILRPTEFESCWEWGSECPDRCGRQSIFKHLNTCHMVSRAGWSQARWAEEAFSGRTDTRRDQQQSSNVLERGPVRHQEPENGPHRLAKPLLWGQVESGSQHCHLQLQPSQDDQTPLYIWVWIFKKSATSPLCKWPSHIKA